MLDNKLGSRLVGGNSAYGRNASDFYPTPPDATQALVNFLKEEFSPIHTIWEPDCGDGRMVKVLERNGYEVEGTDIKDGTDFLTAGARFQKPDWIITNPPFSLAEEFIRKAAEYNVPFAMLLKSQFWHAKKRYPLFYEIKPRYILPLTWRPDFLFGKRGSGSPLMDVMWCVWVPYKFSVTLYQPLERPKGLEDNQ